MLLVAMPGAPSSVRSLLALGEAKEGKQVGLQWHRGTEKELKKLKEGTIGGKH